MGKFLTINDCIQCFNLKWCWEHEGYYCKALDRVINVEKEIPKDCPRKSIFLKGK